MSLLTRWLNPRLLCRAGSTTGLLGCSRAGSTTGLLGCSRAGSTTGLLGCSRAGSTTGLLGCSRAGSTSGLLGCSRAGSALSLQRALILLLVTFCVALPLCCHRLVYSYYYIKSVYLESMSDSALQDSFQRGQEALRYWTTRTPPPAPQAPPPAPQAPPPDPQAPPPPELLVTVVTARRTGEGWDFHYLLQVMQRLAGLLADCRREDANGRCAEVLVCDVESGPLGNEDAALLEGWFHVVRPTPEERRKIAGGGVNIFEKEKRDYVFCLKRGWELVHPRHMVVLEDDALPRQDFLPVIQDILSRRFSRHSVYVKLYHPERLQRYWNPEPYRLAEWLGAGVLGATLIMLTVPTVTLCPSNLLFFTIYSMAVIELVGRHYLLEVRRLSAQLYSVSPATECCTPAMLFPFNSSHLVTSHLERSQCVKGRAKDMVLYQLTRGGGAATRGRYHRGHSLEPNLVTHIGAFSSVRSNPPKPRIL